MVELRNISFNYVYHGASFYRSRFHAFSWEAPDFTLNDLLQLSQSEEIPLILHQTWKDHLLPEKFKIMTGTWKVSNPKLKRILWTDQDNLLLLKLFHPEWLALYQELPKKIYQLYFMRYVYLLVFGGVYADLDTAAYRSVVPLLKGHNLVLGEVSNDREWPHNIPNAMMASKPDQAFWSFVISKIVALKPRDYARNTPELTAGPGLLHQSVKEWKAMSLPSHSLFILPPGYWFGVDWRSPTPPCDAVRKDIKYLHLCKESLGNFYVITIWSHSWS
ncbi:nucleotide-diphospho-sugar transferase [Gorgonomyces haynaldii]|nr:nucleotide-diphospho-sugar transferase [Gorgonomyces haynaldii]